MCNSQNLPLRVTKAKAALHFIKVAQRDYKNRPVTFYITGSDAKLYHVILKRTPVLSAELHLVVNNCLVKPGFAYKTLTYHALAVVMLAARDQGYRVQWCANQKDAQRLKNLGGTLFALHNRDNIKERMYGVYFNDR